MRQHMTNFSSAQGFELPKQGQFHVMPSEFLSHISDAQQVSHKPFLMSAETADKIVKSLAVASLFVALFMIGLYA